MVEGPGADWGIARLEAQDEEARAAAARLLVDEFRESSPDAWPTLEAAEAEVAEALGPGKLALAAISNRTGALIGWIGAQPMYGGNVWELHPLVVRGGDQGRGIGRALVEHLEEELRGRGASTLWLGSDDETNLTNLGGVDLYPNVLEKLTQLTNLGRHPMGFYGRLGFEVVGVVPDANGFGKPDILMAKRVGRRP